MIQRLSFAVLKGDSPYSYRCRRPGLSDGRIGLLCDSRHADESIRNRPIRADTRDRRQCFRVPACGRLCGMVGRCDHPRRFWAKVHLFRRRLRDNGRHRPKQLCLASGSSNGAYDGAFRPPLIDGGRSGRSPK